MADSNSLRERTECITVAISDETGVLEAEDQLEEALRAIHDLRISGDQRDLHKARVSAMEACVHLADAVDDGLDCEFVDELE